MLDAIIAFNLGLAPILAAAAIERALEHRIPLPDTGTDAERTNQ